MPGAADGGMGRGGGVAAVDAAAPQPEKLRHRLQHVQPPPEDQARHAEAMEAAFRKSRAVEMAAWDVW